MTPIRIRLAVLLAATGLLLLTGAVTLLDVVNPPFTDAQIRASVRDTWQAYATFTRMLLVLHVAIAAFALVLLRSATTGRERVVATACIAMAIGATAAALTAHAHLTTRVTALTGQAFGALYGLF